MTDPLAPLAKAARRRSGDVEWADVAAAITPDWKQTEQAVTAELRRNPKRAAKLIDAFARAADAAGESEARGRAERLHASAAFQASRYAASLGHCEQAERLLRGAARDGARLGAAAALLRLGRGDESAAACRAARRSAMRRGDALLAAGADLNEGLARHESGNPAAALRLYERAAAGFETAGRSVLALHAANNAANALVLLDRFADAEKRHADVATRSADAGLDYESARCHYNRGALLGVTDRLGEADDELLAAEAEFRRLGDPVQAALCRLDRGAVLLAAGLIPEARHALESARRALRRGGPQPERARATLLLARSHLAAGDTASARALLRRPLPAGGALLEGQREALLGKALAAAGRHAAAREQLGAAAKRLRRHHPAEAARVRAAEAWTAHAAGAPTTARRLASAALRAATEHGLPSLAFAAHAVRFLVEDSAGRPTAAARSLDGAVAALDDVGRRLRGDDQHAALLEGREQWLARAIRHRLDHDGIEAALGLVERFRAHDLASAASQTGRLAGSDDALDALRGRIAALERRLDDGALPGFLRGADSATRTRQSALRRAERKLARAVRTESRGAPTPAFDLAAFRATLPAGTVVLAPLVDEHGTVIAALSRDAVHVARHPATLAETTRLANDLRFRLSQFTVGAEFARRHATRLAASTDRTLAALAGIALAPVAAAIADAERVIVVPHGPWHRVPFAALPHDGAPLVVSRVVALAPALSQIGAAQRAARGRPVVMAHEDTQAPAIAEEAHRAADALPGSRLFVGDRARFDALSRRSAPRVLHVAAHGRYRADAPLMSGVRLADGWLRAADLRSLALRGSLVVFSGCETGVARVESSDEARGLVRGAFLAGARAVVASLWRVDDPATARLMHAFHRADASKDAPAALAIAQRALIADGLHPFYWAAFGAWTRRP